MTKYSIILDYTLQKLRFQDVFLFSREVIRISQGAHNVYEEWFLGSLRNTYPNHLS